MPGQRNRQTMQKPKGLSKNYIRKLAEGGLGKFCHAKNYRGDQLGVGRNDPCPCGSGKKFKKCHGGVSDEAAN